MYSNDPLFGYLLATSLEPQGLTTLTLSNDRACGNFDMSYYVNLTDRGKEVAKDWTELPKKLERGTLYMVKIATADVTEITGILFEEGNKKAKVEFNWKTTPSKQAAYFKAVPNVAVEQTHRSAATMLLYDDGWRLMSLELGNGSTVSTSAPPNAPAPEITASSTNNSPAQTSGTSAIPSPTCGEYEICLKSGISALTSSQWDLAIADFKQATVLDASKPSAWAWLGAAYLSSGQKEQAPDLWDKALRLGGPIVFPVCWERKIGYCRNGSFRLGRDEVSFTNSAGEKIFGAPSSQVSAKGTISSLNAQAGFRVEASGKNYDLDFVPVGLTCDRGAIVQCPPEGTTQQLTVANYVSHTIPKLGSGTLSQAPPAISTGSSASSPSSNSSCDQAKDSGYSILLQGHLYKVRATSSPNPDHLFYDERGSQVVDLNLVQQLSSAAWTRDNIVASPDVRNASLRVAGLLTTSKALQGYSNAQDLLARGMVEALESVVTDGASLTKAVPNLTGGVLVNQLKNAPKTIFVLTAQRGLEQSLAAYKQMESVPLPPADATVLNGPDLVRIKTYYSQARTLDLPYAALAAKLMPTTGSQLTNQAFASVISELIPSTGVNNAEMVTLKSLLDLQKSVGNLRDTLPALQDFSQNVKLALNLAAAENKMISEWATKSASACGPSPAKTASQAGNTLK
jgi:tetratricopeptide (TPR) repeat protein